MTARPPLYFPCDGCDNPCELADLSACRVTTHGGDTLFCRYCDDCAALAAVDWNHETASIVGMLPSVVHNSDIASAMAGDGFHGRSRSALFNGVFGYFGPGGAFVVLS